MSKTPRTDANTKTVQHTSYYMGAALSAKIEVVDADIARQLETELNDARAEIERKSKLIEKLAGAAINAAALIEVFVPKDRAKIEGVWVKELVDLKEALTAYREMKDSDRKEGK